MQSKVAKKLRIAPLLQCELVPITDPTVQAAVDRLFELREGEQLSKADKKLLTNLPSGKKPTVRKRK